MINKASGDYGEELACQYLRNSGYRILDRNFRIRGGEIDIVAREGDTLVFIEVKTRYSHEYGLPVESMVPWKIRALLKTARFYIQKIKWGEREYRLDFVGVDFCYENKDPKVELIRNITG